MQKYWDAVLVGVMTFIVVAIILAIKPGYTPVEVSDEILNPPAAVEEEALDEGSEIEVEETEEATQEAE